MSVSIKNLHRQQIDDALDQFRPLVSRRPPSRGWAREIRRALGITETQLGRRLGLAQSSVAELEASEAQGTASLNSLRRLAEALDGDLVYAIVPRRPLAEMLRSRVEQFARGRVKRVSHTMRLEDQPIPQESLDRQTQALIRELMEKPPRRIWD